jgi:hypothetical protein
MMDVFTWSMPFVFEKVNGMLSAILTKVCEANDGMEEVVKKKPTIIDDEESKGLETDEDLRDSEDPPPI